MKASTEIESDSEVVQLEDMAERNQVFKTCYVHV